MPRRIHTLFVLVWSTLFSQLFVSAFVSPTRRSRPVFGCPVSQLTDPEHLRILAGDNSNEESSTSSSSVEELDVTEVVWRYAKKPLLRIGGKGATKSHGNSLRQLLEDHTVVKVKVNTKTFQNSIHTAYETLRNLAIENGASPEIELIQLREGTKEILFALPGTIQRMEDGTFPPYIPPVNEEDDDDDASFSA